MPRILMMPNTRNMLAIDLGAESGRGVIGSFDGSKIALEVIHRFPNGPVVTLDSMHWDVLRLHAEILNALRFAAQRGIASVGVDTWGVDFALLGRGGTLLGNPRHYRDPHTEHVMDRAFRVLPRQQIYQRTGLQFLRFNTLFQLLALKDARSPLLDLAEQLLFMPDLFHYFLTGIKVNEYTDASTSQMLDPVKRSWAYDLVGAFGLPTKMLGTIVPPGTVLGPLRTSVASETGVVPVIAPATHDTASAIAAAPAQGESWAYISSGTWSLIGVELPQPLVNDATLAANFTNEGGVAGTTRLLKNVMGLWLVQECKRAWEKAGIALTYDDLVRLAQNAAPFASLIDPDDPRFMLPANMPVAIAEFCRETGQTAPSEPAAVVRCCLESLAFKYRWVVEKLEQLLGRRFEVIHVVGGGCQNALLCQWTADACGRPVIAGPVEATALGNVLVQAMGLGLISNLADAREIVRRSVEVVRYEPRVAERWNVSWKRFEKLVQSEPRAVSPRASAPKPPA